MPARQGGRAGADKIRKPQLSALAKETREKQRQLVRAATSAMTSPTSPRSPTSPQIMASSSISPLPASSLSALPASSLSPLPASSPSPPPANMPSETSGATARAWVSSLEEGRRQILMMLVMLKNRSRDINTPEKLAGRVEAVKSFLRYLEYEVEMTPAIKAKLQLDQVLAAPERPDLSPTAPPEIAAECRRLLDQYNEENWGADDVPDGPPAAAQQAEAHDHDHGEPGPTPPTAGPTAPASDTHTATMRLPDPAHPIWGLEGIMHGWALKPGNIRYYIADPRYTKKKRNPKVYGHNGFEPGDWWPLQKIAHFWGCHGAPICGISGGDEGAYSIVSSGASTYDALDQDFGDKLLYSADNSHDNTDPNRVTYTSNMTKKLHTSIATGKPVRVLRSAGGKKAYTPACGIRYDGLYRVMQVREVLNNRGGLYEQFELRRLPNQRSLEEIRRIPTQEQQTAYNKMKDGY
ncbi:E3 ubiquitin-protein ligase UHRF1 [Rhypophila decipiens]|uniref:E3 ubiquitin-protein ligase UHRF1 n=1 Tax=Rhypophila decipiens TaxID=261697 RepID=A0AAN7B8M7_9PEZI|nr:E3 ubiquitin-protein ligase UHRF1 [Rhypophila decipiens]